MILLLTRASPSFVRYPYRPLHSDDLVIKLVKAQKHHLNSVTYKLNAGKITK